MKIIKTEDSVVINEENKNNKIFQRENLTKKEMESLLLFLNAYRRKKYYFFGKKEWHVPNDTIRFLRSELY